METDWAENRAKMPQDFIRRTVGKVFETLYSTGERDKFRTRLEPARRAPRSTSAIAAWSRSTGSSSSDKDRGLAAAAERPGTRGRVPAPADAQARCRPGARATQVASAGAARPRDHASGPDAVGHPELEILEGFDRAWRRVGLALDRGGFTVEDRDRSQGAYFVRYIDPEVSGAQKPGFFGRLFSSKPTESISRIR